MKRCVAMFLFLTMLFSLASCGAKYKSRTAEFYGVMDRNSFWYSGEVVTAEDTYSYSQAIDKDSVTTIEDHKDDAYDGYVIYDGKYMHKLNLKNKKYDTVKTDNGVKFLFGDNDYSDFNTPDSVVEQATFLGNTLYCEIFNTVDEQGNTKGENKYYYNNERLVGIEWYENGKLVTVLHIESYSNTIPSEIFTSIPSDFKAGTFTSEQVIPPSEKPGGTSDADSK